MDRVRRAEHRALSAAGDDRLAGSKYLWFHGWEYLPPAHRQRIDQPRGWKLRTSRAWAIKETFCDFWASQTVEEGKEFFHSWYSWAIRSRLAPIQDVARSFKNHLDNILTFFTHRINNAAVEGLNDRIAGLVKRAFGYRSRERFKTDILFHLGGLDLYPG